MIPPYLPERILREVLARITGGGDVEEKTEPAEPWVRYSAAAFAHAMQDDMPGAGQILGLMQRTLGANTLPGAMQSWVDTLIAAAGGQEAVREKVSAELILVPADPGQVGPPPESARWTARMICARAEMDERAWQAALDELTDDNLGLRVMQLLSACARTTRFYQRLDNPVAAVAIPRQRSER